MLDDSVVVRNKKVGGGRSESVDFLKGLAVLFVIIIHSQINMSKMLLFGYWGGLAVPIFMILTGYNLSNSYKRGNIKGFSDAYDQKKIVKSLIRFLVPFTIVYLGELIIFGVYYLVTDVWMPAENPVVLYIRGGTGAGSYYTPIMVQLIFLFPLIYFIMKANFQKGLSIAFIFNLVYEICRVSYGMPDECYRLIVLRNVFAIAYGVYLSMNPKQTQFKKRRLFWFIIGVIYIYIATMTSYNFGAFSFWKETSLFSILYVAPIISLILKKEYSIQRMKMLFPLEFIGKCSYNIFLCNMVFTCTLLTYIRQYNLLKIYELLISIFISVVGGMVFYMIEKPITFRLISFYTGSSELCRKKLC